jgi:predicted dehydrogenase
LKNKIKLGLIGCGKQAAKHIASIQKLNVADIFLADIQVELAQALADKTGVSRVKHPDTFFEMDDIQAILICTPTPTHGEFIAKALKNEKYVFCEKPLCASLEEAQALKAAESRSKKSVMVGYVYRYVPVFEEGHRLASQYRINSESMVLGKPLCAFFRLGGRGSHQLWKHRKNQGGGAINEMLVHMIDLASWYFGSLKDVEVISKSLKSSSRLIQGNWEKVDAEDMVMIRCTGDNGVDVFCQADLITPAFTQYAEIQFENGTFMGSIQPEMPSFLFLKEGRAGYDSGRTALTFGKRNVLDIQMAAFIQSVVKGVPPDRNRIEDSIKLMKIVETVRTA